MQLFYPDPVSPASPLFILAEYPQNLKERGAAHEQLLFILKQLREYAGDPESHPLHICVIPFGQYVSNTPCTVGPATDMLHFLLSGPHIVDLSSGLLRLEQALTQELEDTLCIPFFRPNILLLCSGAALSAAPASLETLKKNVWFSRAARWVILRDLPPSLKEAEAFTSPAAAGGPDPHVLHMPPEPLNQGYILSMLGRELTADASREVFQPTGTGDLVHVDFPEDGPEVPLGYMVLEDDPGDLDGYIVPADDPVPDGPLAFSEYDWGEFSPEDDGFPGTLTGDNTSRRDDFDCTNNWEDLYRDLFPDF